MAPTCPTCRRVHDSGWVVALDRFGGAEPRYLALGAQTPPRDTRAEAEADACAHRATRPGVQASTPAPDGAPSVTTPPAPAAAPVPAADEGQGVGQASAGVEHIFPAAEWEACARAQAWQRWLAEIECSLLTWQLDAQVRAGCEDPRVWLRRCIDELEGWAA